MVSTMASLLVIPMLFYGYIAWLILREPKCEVCDKKTPLPDFAVGASTIDIVQNSMKRFLCERASGDRILFSSRKLRSRRSHLTQDLSFEG